MRKLVYILSISLLFLAGQQVSAQNDAYNIGDKTASIGLTVGYYGYGFLGSRSIGFPPITLTGEYGFHEYVSAGAYLGFASWKYDYSGYGYNYSYRWSFVSAGARATFHYLPLLNENLELDIDEEKFDFYLSVIAGLEFQNYKSDDDIIGVDYSNDVDLAFGPFAGFKYMVNEQLGVFAEGGWNAFGFFTLGASIRF
jgi:hypothetical protein